MPTAPRCSHLLLFPLLLIACRPMAEGAAPALCEAKTTPIAVIQGSGDVSPRQGDTVTVRGVVAGDFQRGEQLNGFFLASEAADGDPATSDGLFVYSPRSRDVEIGDLVAVRGRVTEFHGLTELAEIEPLAICEHDRRVVPYPLVLGGELEPYEGMLVTVPETLVADDSYNLGRYGQLTAAAGERLFHPLNVLDGVAESRPTLIIDDGSLIENPRPVPYLGNAETLRLGATIRDLTGVVSFHHEAYVLHPTSAPRFTAANPRPPAPPAVGGMLRIASFNLLNYFTTLGERGADDEAQRRRQLRKLVAAITALDADVVGLLELENNGTRAQDDLVAALNGDLGDETYMAVSTPAEGLGTDNIRVGMLYRPSRLRTVGESRTSIDPVFAGRRPPLAQIFTADGISFGVVVAHLKSKSCRDATGADLDQGDEKGCWNPTRVAQAQRLLDLIEELGAETGGRVLLAGDLNAYGGEDPIRALVEGGLVDQVAARLPPPARYSFVYYGRAGYLDHVLTTPALHERVTGVGFWHINADEPRVLDYREEPTSDAPYRSSDHDPVLVGLDLRR